MNDSVPKAKLVVPDILVKKARNGRCTKYNEYDILEKKVEICLMLLCSIYVKQYIRNAEDIPIKKSPINCGKSKNREPAKLANNRQTERKTIALLRFLIGLFSL